MLEHTSPVSGVAASGQGLIATAGYDNRVILWDAKTKLGLAAGMHDHLANQCDFSSCNGYLVSSGSDYTARIWQLPSMSLYAICTGHADDVEMSKFSPDGQFIATASRDHCLRIFNINGTLERKFCGHTADVLSVVWSEDGETLVTSSDDGTVKRWNRATGSIIQEFDMGGVETDTIVVTQDGSIIAGDDTGKITVLDASIEASERYSTQAHSAGIKSISYDRESNRLVTTSYDRSVCVWNLLEGERPVLTSRVELPAILWARSSTFIDQDHLVFSSFGSSYITFNLSNNCFETQGVKNTQGVNAVSFVGGDCFTIGDAGAFYCNNKHIANMGSLCNFLTLSGDVLLTGGQLGSVFDTRTGIAVYTHKSPINCATAFNCGGENLIAVGAYTGEVIILKQNSADGHIKYIKTIKVHENAIKGIAFSDGLIFSVCATGAASLNDAQTFSCIKFFERAHSKIANGCVALDSGTGFASVGRDLNLRFWYKESHEMIDTPHDHSIKCVAANQHFVATGSYDGRVAVFNTNTRRWDLNRRFCTSGISSLCKGPNGFIASSYNGQTYNVELPA